MNKQEKQESKRLPVFYIALCCCVIAVGVAGYFTEKNTPDPSTTNTITHNNLKVPESEIVSKDEDIASVAVSEIAENVEDNSTLQSDISITKADFPQIDTVIPQAEDSSLTSEPITETAAITENPQFIIPVTGDILEEFSKELTYNNALCDWRAHTGVDIGAQIGESVVSMCDGTVTKISSDEMGKYIEIDHGNGFLARYSRLLGTESCEVGKEIKSGEVIGTISEGGGENITAPHLHLELYKDNETVNPMEYINK